MSQALPISYVESELCALLRQPAGSQSQAGEMRVPLRAPERVCRAGSFERVIWDSSSGFGGELTGDAVQDVREVGDTSVVVVVEAPPLLTPSRPWATCCSMVLDAVASVASSG